MPTVDEISNGFMELAQGTAARRGFAFEEAVRNGLLEMAHTASTRILEGGEARGADGNRYVAVHVMIGRQGFTYFVDEMIVQQSRAILEGRAASGADPGDFTASHPWVINASIFQRAKDLFCPFLFFC